MATQVLLDASIKRQSRCFLMSTVAAFQLNSSILSPSMSHGYVIRKTETSALAAQSKKIFKEASNDVPVVALGDRTNGLHLLHTRHIWLCPM